MSPRNKLLYLVKVAPLPSNRSTVSLLNIKIGNTNTSLAAIVRASFDSTIDQPHAHKYSHSQHTHLSLRCLTLKD